MKTGFKHIHTWAAQGPAELGGQIDFVELPLSYVYFAFIVRALVQVTAGVAAPVGVEDRQFRSAARFQLKRPGRTPIDVIPRQLGFLDEHQSGVIHDIQETAPLAIGVNILDYSHWIPLCDPAAPFASPAWGETMLVAPRYRKLEFGVQMPPNLAELYTPGGGGNVVLDHIIYQLFAWVGEDPVRSEIPILNSLSKEMRYQSQNEELAVGVAAAYGKYRNTNLDSDCRPIRLGMLSLDNNLRVADLLVEATSSINGVFRYPENCPANVIKAENVRRSKVDLPDGYDVIDLDILRDHVSVPWVTDKGTLQLWRTRGAGVAGGTDLGVVQQSIGEAEYSDKIA